MLDALFSLVFDIILSAVGTAIVKLSVWTMPPKSRLSSSASA